MAQRTHSELADKILRHVYIAAANAPGRNQFCIGANGGPRPNVASFALFVLRDVFLFRVDK